MGLNERDNLSHLQSNKRFDRRKNDLTAVLRFSDHPEMEHRNNLYEHSLRVQALSIHFSEVLSAQGFPIDRKKIHFGGLVHDDHEVLTGDISKAKKMDMGPLAQKTQQIIDYAANDTLSRRYYSRIPLNKARKEYRAMHNELREKTSFEARVINIADKVEGLCETIHDIRSGHRMSSFDAVLERYRDIFTSMNTNEILLAKITTRSEYNVSIESIPTREEIYALPQLKRDTWENNQTQFWQDVFDPRAPQFYKTWINMLINDPRLNPFPGWK